MANVLVVDDHEDLREMIKMNLELEGYDVTEASNGEKALASLEENIPDIIILDCMMPVMNGIETCKRIRNSGRYSSVYIIMLSAKADSQDVVSGLDVGAASYVTKPFVPQSLVAQVKAGLRTVEDRKHALFDPLTELYNRRSFETMFVREMADWKRYQHSLAFALLDLDHFKNVNDTYGHDVGDAVLKELAVLLKENARPSDIPCRWGGEEFAWLMPQQIYAARSWLLNVYASL